MYFNFIQFAYIIIKCKGHNISHGIVCVCVGEVRRGEGAHIIMRKMMAIKSVNK